MAEGGEPRYKFPRNVVAKDSLFFNEDRNKYKKDFKVAATFAYELFKDVLFKYGLDSLANNDSFQNVELGGGLSPYCAHIGESVVVVSYIHRLKLKVMFDQVLPYIIESEFHYEKIAYGFVKSIYAEGFTEQFLIVCGFFVEYTLYIAVKCLRNLSDNMCILFGDIFRYLIRDKFYSRGGWSELKRQCRPWWHTYRNYYYRREREISEKGSDAALVYGADMHSPLEELNNNNLTALMLFCGHSTEIKTFEKYYDVKLDDIVPRPLVRLSPICELEEVRQQEELERMLANLQVRDDSEGKETEQQETN